MALGTLAEVAVRLVISGYIFAVVVYVNASGNWDKDDDLGTRASARRAHHPENTRAHTYVHACSHVNGGTGRGGAGGRAGGRDGGRGGTNNRD
jgi:hypothetical protein